MNKRYWFSDILINLATFLKDIIIGGFMIKNDNKVDIPIVVVPPVKPDIIIPPSPILPRQKLYLVALSCIGVDASPNDIASDEYGCMETIDSIYHETFWHFISGTQKITISTYLGINILKSSKRFKRVYEYKQGVIIICATGYSHIKNTPIPNGHVGIIGENNKILSNNSFTGKFDDSYTIKTWTDRYVIKGGYDIYLFEPVGL